VFIQRKRGRAAGTTLQAPYTMLRLHIYFSAPHLIIPHYSQMSSPPSPNVPPNWHVPGNLIWGFVLCFLAVGVLGVYKNHARVGCQLRIRGGGGACYRKV